MCSLKMQPKLSISIGTLKLKNPMMVASGTFGYAEEFKGFINLKELGAIVTKSITLAPRKGNPPPRTCETPAGMLNSIGLENPGIEVFIKEKLPFLKKIGVPIIVSIASQDDPDEFIALTKRLDKIKEVAAIELNISCPNIGHRSLAIGHRSNHKNLQPITCNLSPKLIAQDPKATYAAVNRVRRVTRKTLITKLSPNVTDITDIAKAAQAAGTDAVSLINTVAGMSIDVKTRKPKIATITGGLSGPAIRPIALRMVWEVYQNIKLPIIGVGGIIDVPSALEFFIAGATAVAIGTANFLNPKVSVEIIRGIKEYLIKNKIQDIKEIIGKMDL